MNYKLEVPLGSDFTKIAFKAKTLANEDLVEFDFNGIKCLVGKNTDLDLLFRDYQNASIMNWKVIGPDCIENYNPEVELELQQRREANRKKAEKQRKDWLAKEKKERKQFESKVKGIELEFSDEKGWNESRRVNSDGYGRAILDYAEAWAKLMQIEIINGKTVEDCYDYTQDGLGFFGISGFQFGAAVFILSQTWKYGEELRRVHNKKYGVENKDGVINPAILSF